LEFFCPKEAGSLPTLLSYIGVEVHRVGYVTYVSGEYVSSIFRVEEYAKQETNVKQMARTFFLPLSSGRFTDCTAL
jgi:hypothetical protein